MDNNLKLVLRLIRILEVKNPELAEQFKAELKAEAKKVETGQASRLQIKIGARIVQFDGDYSPEKQPVEVTEYSEVTQL